MSSPGPPGALSEVRAQRRPVIVGLGLVGIGRAYEYDALTLAAEAVRSAAADAGLRTLDVDGLLTSEGITGQVNRHLTSELALPALRLQAEMYVSGASAIAMVQYAGMAVMHGVADTVACVFGDTPVRPSTSPGDGYVAAFARHSGFSAIPSAVGIRGPKSRYAQAARRHMHLYGTRPEHLAHVAVAARSWAVTNPIAQQRAPLSIADHQASRLVSDPFRLLDCCLVSNGAVAVLVTTAERAEHLDTVGVHIHGWAQHHSRYSRARGSDWGLQTGAALCGPAALGMAGLGVADVDIAQLYDCFTFATLVSLEDYGFCAKGDGGDFVASGAIAPGGVLPVNTGGGQLSGFYMWGMTPLAEGIAQARGTAGDRQIPRSDVVLVSNNGGVFDHHATLILSRHARS